VHAPRIHLTTHFVCVHLQGGQRSSVTAEKVYVSRLCTIFICARTTHPPHRTLCSCAYISRAEAECDRLRQQLAHPQAGGPSRGPTGTSGVGSGAQSSEEVLKKVGRAQRQTVRRSGFWTCSIAFSGLSHVDEAARGCWKRWGGLEHTEQLSVGARFSAGKMKQRGGAEKGGWS
jgi:hypothetical protein